jgi:hypothetical protein
VIGFGQTWPTTQYDAIDTLVDTVYHRSVMMTQGFTVVGVAAEDGTSPAYFDMALIKPQVNAGDYVGVYPAANQTGVWLTHSVESPNPFYQEMDMTQANMCAKTSAPVSIASEASTTLSVTSFTVTEDGQSTPLDVRLITVSSSAQDKTYLPANVAFVVGKAPFKANTKYNVHFTGMATGSATGTTSGMKIDKSWSFTTGFYARGC